MIPVESVSVCQKHRSCIGTEKLIFCFVDFDKSAYIVIKIFILSEGIDLNISQQTK